MTKSIADVVATPRERPACRGGGLGAGGAATLMDVVIMVKGAWEELEWSAIAHCWAKADVLGAIRNANLLRLLSKYRRLFRTVFNDVDDMLELMQGTSLGGEALVGLKDVAELALVEEWVEIEKRPVGIVGAAEPVVQDEDTAGGDVADSADTWRKHSFLAASTYVVRFFILCMSPFACILFGRRIIPLINAP